MIRTFRLYRLDAPDPLPVSKVQERLRSAKLLTAALTVPQPLSRILSDLGKRLTRERLDLVRARRRRWELALTGLWPARSITVATAPVPRLPIRVPLWLRRTTPWLVVFEASRTLADAAARLVSTAMTGHADRVRPVLPDVPHWEALEQWVEKNAERGGGLLGGRFYQAEAGGVPVEWIALRYTLGSDRKLLREIVKTAAGIGELLFQTPRLTSLERSLVCRVSRAGVIRIYMEEVSDEVIDAFLFELESLWGLLPDEFPTRGHS